ncbi:MAG: hypothetical protein JKY54_04730 [Flavobacteriales bacterium]|nr:hypothetical protein [Flavobacteriales bacterium]
MRKTKFISVFALFLSCSALAGPHYASGQITSLSADATNPAIRLTSNKSPDLCDGGTYGWLYFKGTSEERTRVYSSAMALAISGKTVTVYTNSDNERCEIYNIQALGLN